jgi:hypothetical protein
MTGPTKLRRLAGADASGAVAAEGEEDEEGHADDKALVGRMPLACGAY